MGMGAGVEKNQREGAMGLDGEGGEHRRNRLHWSTMYEIRVGTKYKLDCLRVSSVARFDINKATKLDSVEGE
ncbi:unnamed protein product [Prunus armeniaca]|uniref:Uncharacterized protein n=1 Tax=Prunus armeniaca TaxID=36596 RepID=A0A6J5VJ31_PRUAR|nr:unnamed protein product [Prunus armeniaca]CAB4319320.1 unnamed protein product [Prunus armeniaca]